MQYRAIPVVACLPLLSASAALLLIPSGLCRAQPAPVGTPFRTDLDLVDPLASWRIADGSGEALYAGGDSTTAGGVVVNHIAKWDGTAWSALSGPSGTGTDQSVETLAVYDDGSGEALYASRSRPCGERKVSDSPSSSIPSAKRPGPMDC